MVPDITGAFGPVTVCEFGRAVGLAPLPFQIKSVDAAVGSIEVIVVVAGVGSLDVVVVVAGVGTFGVVVVVFGSSPPITGVRGRLELNVLSSPLPFSLPKLNRGLPPSS